MKNTNIKNTSATNNDYMKNITTSYTTMSVNRKGNTEKKELLRSLKSNTVLGKLSFKHGLTSDYVSRKLNTIDELNTWFVLNMYFVCRTSSEGRELQDIYSEAVKKFGYTVDWNIYIDFNSNDAAAALGQQKTSMAALIEHYTNAVDAVKGEILMEAGLDYTKDINIVSKSSNEMFTLKEIQEQDLSDKIEIDIEPIESDKEHYNFIFRDKGIGVNASNFESTLLSTLAGNKKNIKFMQGTFNIGSAGILQYCTMKCYLSRRSEVMGDSDGNYGFTVVRKGKLRDVNNDNGFWEYMLLKDSNGNTFIPSISKDVEVEYIYGRLGDVFDYGTAIKCFEVEAPDGVRPSNAKEFTYNLNVCLVDPLIAGYVYHIAEETGRNVYGRLAVMDNYALNKECLFVHQITDIPLYNYSDEYYKSGDIHIKLVFNGLNQNEDGLRENYVRKRPLTFSLNGQTQGYLLPSELETKMNMTGFGRVVNYCMFDVKMDDVPASLRSQFFSSNREDIKDSKFAKAVIKAVINHLRTNSSLEAMISEFNSSVDVNKTLMETINSGIKKDRMMLAYMHKYSAIIRGQYRSFIAAQSSKNTKKETLPYDGTRVFDDFISDKTVKEIVLRPNSKERRISFSPKHLTKDDLLSCNWEVTYGKYNMSKATYDTLVKTGNRPSIAGLARTSIYPILGGVSNVDEDRVLTVPGTDEKRGIIKTVLRPDFANITDTDLFFVKCIITKDNVRVYEGTGLIYLGNPPTGKKRPNKDYRGDLSVDDEDTSELPPLITISRDGDETNGVLSYKMAKNILKKDGIIVENWDNYAGSLVMDNISLDKVYINLDSTEYKSLSARNNKEKSSDILSKVYMWTYKTYMTNLVKVADDMVKRMNAVSDEKKTDSVVEKESFSETDIQTLKGYVKSIENNLNNVMSFM